MKMLIEIFFGFLRIGLIAFGGAYAAIPLVENEAVAIHHWLTYEEFSNLLAIDELTPGPIIINCATFIGTHLAGVPGAIVASIACITPGIILALILVWFYRKYQDVKIVSDILYTLKCMTIALIFATMVKMIGNIWEITFLSSFSVNYPMVLLSVLSFALIRSKKVDPIVVMLGCGAVNLLAFLLR